MNLLSGMEEAARTAPARTRRSRIDLVRPYRCPAEFGRPYFARLSSSGFFGTAFRADTASSPNSTSNFSSSFSFFIFVFYHFTPFFFLAKGKGPKRTAPACRARLGAGRPLGAGPVFPRIASGAVTEVGCLRVRQISRYCGAERINAEKPLPFNRALERTTRASVRS